MKAKLLTTIVVLLLTPGLLYAKDTKDSDQFNILVDALVVCPPNSPVRFVDNGDGTVCDHQTGLMWEMKDAVSDSTENLRNPRDVDNRYTWTSSSGGDYTNPDGTAFTDFLAQLNGEIAGSAPSEQLGSHSDWRLPTSAELQTIVDCNFSPCINPVFGPTTADFYQSSTSDFLPLNVWGVSFNNGLVGAGNKDGGFFVRAVRGGR